MLNRRPPCAENLPVTVVPPARRSGGTASSWVRGRRRLAVVVTVSVAMVAGLLAEIAPAAAATSVITVSSPTVQAAAEYYALAFGDPMDFSNPEDIDTTPRHQITTGTAALADGRLVLSGPDQILLGRADPGATGTSATRDPRSRPLDAGRFRRLSMRLYSDRTAATVIGFHTCFGPSPGCAKGYKAFNLVPGWHTYDLDMTGVDDLEAVPGGVAGVSPPAWAGEIQWIEINPAFNTTAKPQIVLDDVLLYEPSDTVQLQLPPGSGTVELWADYDNDQTNDTDPNGAPAASASRVAVVPAGSLVSLRNGQFRAGVPTRFYTVRNGVRSGSSAPVTLQAASRPTPWVLTPSELSGTDWAGAVRGDAWDFDQQSDASAVNANLVMAGGEGHASTAGPTWNDPGVILNQNNVSIDATIYRRLAVRIRYDGPWGLEDAAGGGMNARIMWRPTGQGEPFRQVSDDIIVQPGTRTYVVDLKTDPPQRILEAGLPNPVGWGTPQATWISMLRWDPHEDRGPRTWHIDDVQLLRNPLAGSGFGFTFEDRTWSPGTTADLYLDTDRSTANGVGVPVATGVPVAAGPNTVPWSGAGVAPGSYWLYLVLRNGAGVATGTWSTGQVDVGLTGAGAPPPADGPAPVDARVRAFWTIIIFLVWVARTTMCTRNVVVAGRAQPRFVTCPRGVRPGTRLR